MKICYVGKQPKAGGVGTVFANDTRAFASLGHEVQAINTTAEEFELGKIDPNVSLILISADIRAAHEIGRSNELRSKALLFIHGRADHLLDPQEGVNYSPLKPLAWLDSVFRPSRLRETSPELISPFYLPLRKILGHISYRGVNIGWLNAIRRFRKVVVPSNFFGEQLKSSLGIDYWKIRPGLDHNYWSPDKEYETEKNNVRIVIPTGFFYFKRLHIGLEKINRVLKELRDKISVEADFIWYNRDYRELREKVQQRYQYINFKDASPDAKRLFCKFDLVVHPSLGDVTPATVLECCALGLPVLASTISEDFMGPHLCYAKTTDPRYEDTLRRLILDAELRFEFSRRARSFAKSWISWEDRARMILRLKSVAT